ncbi:helix-turn-helix transcriptional regulator [Mycobacteroides abscessus]|uniref:helix-turn-helix transcriptional regulator n=1 Tax=Mycobacteroides abscessus TaxID=36809 RepID=UPI002287210B|nr:helix-turn-helix domain-containing protein [Mycobacteroides abscessus]
MSESTAYYWRQIGKGPKGARIGKALRYRHSDVIAWLDEQFARAWQRSVERTRAELDWNPSACTYRLGD